MNFRDVINKRRSVRKFSNKVVDFKLVDEAIEMARKCPSAGAIRGYDAIITTERVVGIDAPVYVVICANPEAYARRYGDRGRDLYAIQDSAVFCAYIQLALVDIGLDSCWVGAFNEGRIKKALNIELRPVAILAIGYRLNS